MSLGALLDEQTDFGDVGDPIRVLNFWQVARTAAEAMAETA